MSEHCGYIVRVENIRKHNNADRLQIATFFGNDTMKKALQNEFVFVSELI